MFFLRMRASLVNEQGESVLLLHVLERDPNDWRSVLNRVAAMWRGPAAAAFFAQHERELCPGCPLNLEFDRLRLRGDEWHANVLGCEFAPPAPSWQRKEHVNVDNPSAESAP